MISKQILLLDQCLKISSTQEFFSEHYIGVRIDSNRIGIEDRKSGVYVLLSRKKDILFSAHEPKTHFMEYFNDLKLMDSTQIILTFGRDPLFLNFANSCLDELLEISKNIFSTCE